VGVTPPSEDRGSAGRFRKLAGMDSVEAPSAESAEAKPPIKLRSFGSMRRTEGRQAGKDLSSLPTSSGPSLQRGPSSGFRGLIGRLRTNKLEEPLFEAVSEAPLASVTVVTETRPDAARPDVGQRQPARTRTSSVVRRTIIMPQQTQVVPAVPAMPRTASDRDLLNTAVTPSRKPSTRRKPVQRLEDVEGSDHGQSRQTPTPTSPTTDASASVSSRYSQPDEPQPSDSEGSILDMYMQDGDVRADADRMEIW
jgi:hypothetical protein